MNWKTIIKSEQNKTYFKDLFSKLEREYQCETVYPKKEHIFRAFDLCKYEDTKVVILGQDPYHGPHQANGLAFSVYKETPPPPSLKNIYKELDSDLNVQRSHGDLSGWAKQGVLLLNTTLTVREKEPASHADCGWKIFTKNIIDALNKKEAIIIFLLWGNHAKKYREMIADHHYIIEGVHPSPLSAYRGFFGSKPFSEINKILARHKQKPIDWSL